MEKLVRKPEENHTWQELKHILECKNKTDIALAISGKQVYIECPTPDLYEKTKKELEKYGFKYRGIERFEVFFRDNQIIYIIPYSLDKKRKKILEFSLLTKEQIDYLFFLSPEREQEIFEHKKKTIIDLIREEYSSTERIIHEIKGINSFMYNGEINGIFEIHYDYAHFGNKNDMKKNTNRIVILNGQIRSYLRIDDIYFARLVSPIKIEQGELGKPLISSIIHTVSINKEEGLPQEHERLPMVRNHLIKELVGTNGRKYIVCGVKEFNVNEDGTINGILQMRPDPLMKNFKFVKWYKVENSRVILVEKKLSNLMEFVSLELEEKQEVTELELSQWLRRKR